MDKEAKRDTSQVYFAGRDKQINVEFQPLKPFIGYKKNIGFS